MKATELRVGNKLQKDNGGVFTVSRIDNTLDVLVEEERGLLSLDYNLFGVPLTEEWLLKFGFYKEDASPVSKHHGPFYSIGYLDLKYSFAFADFRDDWGFYQSYTVGS